MTFQHSELLANDFNDDNQPGVLILAFNRPHTLANLIAQLRLVKPRRIYFSVDGARANRSGEQKLVNEVREQASTFDWECKVSTRFSEVNLGCGLAVSAAITWAFETESQLIILEDDIIPDQTFFPFCIDLLKRYEDDSRVFAISGSNFVPETVVERSNSYRFSPIPHVWGWATWKRSWELYDFDIKNWNLNLSKRELRLRTGGTYLAALMWKLLFDLVATKKIDTWDYQLVYAALKSNALIATSNVNLTMNLGIGLDATHTHREPKYLLPVNSLEFPLRHPSVQVDIEANAWTQREVFGASPSGISAMSLRYVGRTLKNRINLRK